MSDENVANETSRHDFGESATSSTEVETSGQGMDGMVATNEPSSSDRQEHFSTSSDTFATRHTQSRSI